MNQEFLNSSPHFSKDDQAHDLSPLLVMYLELLQQYGLLVLFITLRIKTCTPYSHVCDLL